MKVTGDLGGGGKDFSRRFAEREGWRDPDFTAGADQASSAGVSQRVGGASPPQGQPWPGGEVLEGRGEGRAARNTAAARDAAAAPAR